MYVEINSVQLELICVPERRNGDDFGLGVERGELNFQYQWVL